MIFNNERRGDSPFKQFKTKVSVKRIKREGFQFDFARLERKYFSNNHYLFRTYCEKNVDGLVSAQCRNHSLHFIFRIGS